MLRFLRLAGFAFFLKLATVSNPEPLLVVGELMVAIAVSVAARELSRD